MKKNNQQNSKKVDFKRNTQKKTPKKSSKSESKANQRQNQKGDSRANLKANPKPKSNLRKWKHKTDSQNKQSVSADSQKSLSQKTSHKTSQKIKINPENLIYGRHASFACMNNEERNFNHIYVTQSFIDKHHEEFHSILEKRMINEDIIKLVTRNHLNETIGEEAVHNGIMCDVNPLYELDISDLIIKSKASENYAIGILDEAMDPHNIGAILRSASAFGIKGIIIPKRNSPTNTASLAKSASGALEIVDMIRIGNMKSTLEHLKENDFWIIGMSSGDRSTSIKETRLDGKIAFVFGAEGKGLRDLTAKTCDVISHIPIHRSMESLNLSNAGAITFYEYHTHLGVLGL